jgi:hypothetical protein
MGNTTHPRKAHYFAYQLNSKAKSTLATYRCLALLLQLLTNNALKTHFIVSCPCVVVRPHCRHESCKKNPLYVDAADKANVLNAANRAALSVMKTTRVDADSPLKDSPPLKDPPPTHFDSKDGLFPRLPWGFLFGP